MRLALVWLPALLATVAPATVYTSTRGTTVLAAARDGTLWVGTDGGVLRRGVDGVWTKYTRADGLPSHEIRALTVDGTAVVAGTPLGCARLNGERWAAEPGPPVKVLPPVTATWGEQRWTATPAGLRAGDQAAPLPPGPGSHVSALLPRDDGLLAALFGDGLWRWTGAWQRLDPPVPAAAREVTALAQLGETLVVGTRRAGVWLGERGQWTQHLEPDEPFDHNAQAFASYGDRLWVSTLEDGLLSLGPAGWDHLEPPLLSSPAPRQLAVWRGVLYVRHGTQTVDRYDGRRWTRDVFRELPRREVSALAADERQLYLAQWGGWTTVDRRTWHHCFGLPELENVPVLTLLPSPGRLWVGTQSRGLGEWDPASRTLRLHDERAGLPDDWITALANVDGTLWAGTFVGGLARRVGDRWQPVPATAGDHITALLPDGAGGVYAAAGCGVWQVARDGRAHRLNDRRPWLDTETQCVWRTAAGLWLGTRTGLWLLPPDELGA